MRVVVFGTGFGCLTHVRALQAAGFEVVALVGRDPAKTQERAATFGIPRALTSVEEALRVEGVDAVTIATPPDTHASIVLAAVAAGRHVLCEKPLARDAAEGRTMLAAAEEAGVVHLLGCEFRFGRRSGGPGPGGPRGRDRRAPHGHGDAPRPHAGRPRSRGSRLVGRCRPEVAVGWPPTAPRSSIRSG